jgi:hypothetical protein
MERSIPTYVIIVFLNQDRRFPYVECTAAATTAD